eukprot:m.11843 g.11843  ORF g.11843 m.11843 type:complete len:64 (+) comp7854_c0_seq1:475-666(+)
MKTPKSDSRLCFAEVAFAERLLVFPRPAFHQFGGIDRQQLVIVVAFVASLPLFDWHQSLRALI